MEQDTTQEMKLMQLAVIQRANPMQDDYHTGIRTVDDIRTFAEAWQDEQRYRDCADWGDFTHEQAREALRSGFVTVYSSHDIKQGDFVTTSYTHALQYAGADPQGVKTAIVPLNAVAWIDIDQRVFTGVQRTNKPQQYFCD